MEEGVFLFLKIKKLSLRLALLHKVEVFRLFQAMCLNLQAF